MAQPATSANASVTSAYDPSTRAATLRRRPALPSASATLEAPRDEARKVEHGGAAEPQPAQARGTRRDDRAAAELGMLAQEGARDVASRARSGERQEAARARAGAALTV